MAGIRFHSFISDVIGLCHHYLNDGKQKTDSKDKRTFNNQPPPPFGVLLLFKEERINVLIIFILPSFRRRGGPASAGTG